MGTPEKASPLMVSADVPGIPQDPLSIVAVGDASFYDAPTANNSMLRPLTNQSFLSCLGSDLDVSEARRHPAAPPSEEESLGGRVRSRQRSFPSAVGETTQSPRVRSLGTIVGGLMAEVEVASQSGESRGARSVGVPLSIPSGLANVHHTDSSGSPPVTPSDVRDCQPLLRPVQPREPAELRSFADATSTDLPGKGRTSWDVEMLPTPVDADGASRDPGEAPAPASSGSGSYRGGIELSMDGVMLRKSWRRWGHKVTYLDSCSLHIPAGTVHCITSLNPMYGRCALAVLAGVDAVAHAEGAALANAYPTSALRYRRQVAYVTSLEGCMLEATVEENLLFATRLRFHVDAATGQALCREAAEDTMLTAHLQVSASCLSPARRYLLAIAIELVAAPAVLLLEDPLSFFSLAELQLFVHMLHRLRRRNPHRTIVWCGSTMPWTLFDVVDSITLLSTDGRTFYTGHKKDVETFLQQDLGILGVPGEDVVDIVAQTEQDTIAVAHASFSFRNSRFYRQLQHSLQAHRTRIATDAFHTCLEPSHTPPPYLRVQYLLLAYALRRNVWGRAALVPWVGLFVVILLVCALVVLTEGEGQGNMQNVCGVLFLLLSCSMQINSIFLKAELRDWRTFRSFRDNLYVPVTPYFVATIVRLAAPRLCFAMAGCVCAAVIFQQAAIVSLSLLMALTSFTHACLSLVAVYWLPRLELLLLLNYVYYGYCAIISGFLLSIRSIPGVFQFLSLLRIGYGGLLAAELRGRRFGCNTTAPSSSAESASRLGSASASGSASGSGSGSGVPVPSSLCFTGQDFLDMMGLASDSWGMSALALVLLSLGIVATLGLSMHLASGTRRLSAS
ncbi:hypothetical protein NESM_000457900 [Novymonas esmeraldas]|uniref:ABC transporter domain-containing protein n=1 Tax=Novymonas esmeraldas TaxID=1808958 RepID=A0AAW0EQV3_9TRYP